jgi:hypothetical protein
MKRRALTRLEAGHVAQGKGDTSTNVKEVWQRRVCEGITHWGDADVPTSG